MNQKNDTKCFGKEEHRCDHAWNDWFSVLERIASGRSFWSLVFFLRSHKKTNYYSV
jgi:hypothetical protein